MIRDRNTRVISLILPLPSQLLPLDLEMYGARCDAMLDVIFGSDDPGLLAYITRV
jgi:hypothetical protein